MLRLGEKQKLIVDRKAPVGVYLTEPEVKQEENGQEPVPGRTRTDQGTQHRRESVLLPRNQVPDDCRVGEELEVFLYKDSEDRLIATRKEPALTLHEIGWLTVSEVGRIGAFLDWGLDKDLLLPFHEQPRDQHVRKGDKVLCAVYVDKSGRLAATMNVYPWLSTDSPYRKGDEVSGTVYETSANYGRFVAVDDRYSALIPAKELVSDLRVGTRVKARVSAVRPDGKLDLTLRAPVKEQMEKDAEVILNRLEQNGGKLPLTDRSDPEVIRRELHMSKGQFKRAAGHLLKEKRIAFTSDAIVQNRQN